MEVIFKKEKEAEEIVQDILYRYDNKHGTSPYYQNRKKKENVENIGYYLVEDGVIIGGAVAYQAWDWLFVDIVAIEEEYQRKGLGSQLFRKIEEEARKNNLVGIKLSTLDFQAKGFYEKQGFHKICEIKDCPRGNTKYELVKYLD